MLYPQYQYISTRQDESGNSGFLETLQNYFINFGNGQTQSEDSNQTMDPVEQDKPQSTATDAVKSIYNTDVSPNKLNPTLNENKSKFVYSYVTPASTVPLNSDRRLFYLAEQPQIFGTFSGSPINPVFNLQTVPVVLSRSNVAQPDDPQPNKVISENVQKFSQTPPVTASIEQPSQIQGKSNENKQIDSIVVDAAPENQVLPIVQQPVENIRALSVPIESDVAVTRNNLLPLDVSNESVAPVVAPVVGTVGNVEGNESVQSSVVSPSVKLDVIPANEPSAVSAVVPSVVVEQNLQGSKSVESVVGSV